MHEGGPRIVWKEDESRCEKKQEIVLEGSKANGGKVENSNIIKDENVRLALEEVELRRIWKGYFEDLYNIDIIYEGILVDRVRKMIQV